MAKKEPQSQKNRTNRPKNFLNNSGALPNKTRDFRQIAPESSPESLAKSVSHKFFGVPFPSLMQAGWFINRTPGGFINWARGVFLLNLKVFSVEILQKEGKVQY